MTDSISRRTMLTRAAGACAVLVGIPPVAAAMVNRGRYRLFHGSTTDYSARAVALMQRATVVDMLAPFTLDFPLQAKWTVNPESFTDAQFQKFVDSGISVFHPAIGLGGLDPFQTALVWFAGWNGFIAGNDERLMRVDSGADFARAKRSRKVGVLLGLQNSMHFRRPDDVNFFHGQGQRVSQLTYNGRNLIGNGATERRDDGLSDFGLAIVERMNNVGMAVDVSHCGDRTTLDAFEVSKRPVLITHSNCRALVPHMRQFSDEQRRIATFLAHYRTRHAR